MAEITLNEALARRRTVREFTGAAIRKEALETLIWATQGITGAERQRTAPSAHGLHPLRLFVVANRVDGLDKGTYRVDPDGHSLENIDPSDLSPTLRGAAIDDPPWITDAACIIAICADIEAPNREFADQKPYGERGARYVFLEAGAAAQNLHLQVVAENLGCVWVGGFDDKAVADVLGIKTPLKPLILVCVGYPTPEA